MIWLKGVSSVIKGNQREAMECDGAFFNILDGEIYYEGDTVPIYQANGGGTGYNGEVIKLIKPGFPGLVKIHPKFTNGKVVITEYSERLSEEEIEKWVVKTIHPDPRQYIIAPESIAWSWHFAMQEVVKSHAIKVAHSFTDDDGTEFRMEA